MSLGRACNFLTYRSKKRTQNQAIFRNIPLFLSNFLSLRLFWYVLNLIPRTHIGHTPREPNSYHRKDIEHFLDLTNFATFYQFKLSFIPGVWLSAFNSGANPFVYALLMPTYRKCVISTFCPCANKNKPKRSKNSEGVSETTAN